MSSSVTVTVNTVKNDNERQSFKMTLKTTKYMLSLVLKEKKGKLYALLMIISSLISVIPSIVYIIFPGLIINQLTKEPRIPALAGYISVLIITPVFYQIFNKLIRRKKAQIGLVLSASFTRKFNYYTAMMDYETLENPDIQNKMGRVSGTYNSAMKILDKLGVLLSATLGLFVVLSIISTINIIIIVVVICIMYINSLITKKLNQKRFESNKKLSKYNRYSSNLMIVLNYIGYAKEVRLFDLKSYFAELLYDKKTEENEIHLKTTTDDLNSKVLFSLTNFIQEVFLYIYLIYRVIFTGLAVGSMTIYMSAVGQFASTFSRLVKGYLDLSKDSLDIQELQSFMDIPCKQYLSGNIIPNLDENSVIEFKNVSFKYPGSDRYALHHLNITMHYNEKLCIVGANGSGKTTFIKLLTRLYFPTEGEILLNGININQYDYQQYQRLFAPVFQDFQLYALSLADNIILANKWDKERLDEVCRNCGLVDLVNKLPDGYHTSVYRFFDETGFEPSGGEGQRIAIARALYHGGEFFILDEPTAALDPNAEYEIYTQFNNMIKHKTAVLVTHRLSAVQLADKVAVFDNGHVAEYGTHAELYAKGGIYTEMFDKQAQFYRDKPSEQTVS